LGSWVFAFLNKRPAYAEAASALIYFADLEMKISSNDLYLNETKLDIGGKCLKTKRMVPKKGLDLSSLDQFF
jgi:hypothetical protein